jgi:hypothetical protein
MSDTVQCDQTVIDLHGTNKRFGELSLQRQPQDVSPVRCLKVLCLAFSMWPGYAMDQNQSVLSLVSWIDDGKMCCALGADSEAFSLSDHCPIMLSQGSETVFRRRLRRSIAISYGFNHHCHGRSRGFESRCPRQSFVFALRKIRSKGFLYVG